MRSSPAPASGPGLIILVASGLLLAGARRRKRHADPAPQRRTTRSPQEYTS
ncbi:MAG TPA: hypothetical protein VFH03_09935 [Actinoplanes sp.]|nr:hypothetical protein [Actinoplanes sp.]